MSPAPLLCKFISKGEVELISGARSMVGTVVAVLAISGCATLEDPAAKYPEAWIEDSAYMAKGWKGLDSTLQLNSDGKFEAKGLKARYYECSDAEVGDRLKGGWGSWRSRESDGASVVFLRFSDNCAATFWLGKYKGEIVLWTDSEVDGNLVMLRHYGRPER